MPPTQASIKNKLVELRLMSDDVLVEYISVLMLSGKTIDESRDDLLSVLKDADKLEKLLIWLFDNERHETKDFVLDTRRSSVPTPNELTKFSPVTANASENVRCAFWPMCKFGDDCAYLHPSKLCRNFPFCRYGSSCLYIHPANTATIKCRYGPGCTDPNCLFAHPFRRTANRRAKHRFNPIQRTSGGVSNVLCRFQAACNRPNCPYIHEMKVEGGKHVIEIKDEEAPVVKVEEIEESDDEAFVL